MEAKSLEIFFPASELPGFLAPLAADSFPGGEGQGERPVLFPKSDDAVEILGLLHLTGAEPIAQMPGTAPGLVCPIGGKVIYAVPGVPREMKEMFTGTILPDLRRRAGQSAVIRSRVLRSWGLSESGIDEMLTDRMAELDKRGNPTIAFQASGIEGIKVRLVAKCDDEATAKRPIGACLVWRQA